MTGYFEYINYKKLVRNWVAEQPQKGRGQYKKMAEHLLLSTVTISQVFNGSKDLSLEQALKLSDFMSLSGLKKEFFLLLVQHNRAGSKDLEIFFQQKLDEIRQQSKSLKTRLVQDKLLEDTEKARFYSNWIYSGIRLATSLDNLKTVTALAQRFQLPENKIHEIIEFLQHSGLIIEDNNKLKIGPQRIHLEANSPYIKSRQISWRLKGFERMDQTTSEELFYTAPMSLSSKLAPEIKEEFLTLIEKINEQVVKEKPNDLMCLNIDFFKF